MLSRNILDKKSKPYSRDSPESNWGCSGATGQWLEISLKWRILKNPHVCSPSLHHDDTELARRYSLNIVLPSSWRENMLGAFSQERDQRDPFPSIHLLMKNEHQVAEAFNDVRFLFLRILAPSNNEGMRITCFAPNSIPWARHGSTWEKVVLSKEKYTNLR